MYFLSIFLFISAINALIITRVHRNSIFRPSTWCSFVGNISSWSNNPSIQSCIWECVHEHNCQTAIYFKDIKICSTFSDLCEQGSIDSSTNILASVICYRKNHDPTITCSSTVTTNQNDEEKTSKLIEITNTQPDTSTYIAKLKTYMDSFWSFDNNTSDSLSNFNGTFIGNPTYITPGINSYGSALSFALNQYHYVEISRYKNLTYRSFTVEMWFYCTSLTNSQQGLFGQDHSSNIDESLHYQIRNSKLFLGFYSDDLEGSSTIQTNTWYHAAFVYNYLSSTQQIYLNGKLDGNRSSSTYKGTSGSIVIGQTSQSASNGPQYFSGYIDEVLLTMRAKNASEILDDATLVCWYSFDNDLYFDSGPLHLKGTAVNVTLVAGKVNQAISFFSDSSYYEINGFVLLAVSNHSFSIALWIHPLLINESVLIHISSTINGLGWCADLIKISLTGQILLTVWNNPTSQIIGPVLPANTWTHITNTYSTTHGFQLYVNGTLNGTAGPKSYLAFGQPIKITLANSCQASNASSCAIQPTICNVFNGSIDEFRVYSRELNSMDIAKLVNP